MRGGPEQQGNTPFGLLLRTEFTAAIAWRHLLALVGLSGLGLLLAFWLPQFPESIFRFFRRVFDLPGWPEIVVANDLAGLFFFLYWIGVLDILAIYVVPAEERYLDLWLSKPISRKAYLFARLLPRLLILVGIGALSATCQWLAMLAAGLAYPPLVFAGAAAVILAWTVCLITLVNLLALTARESSTALVIAAIPMLVSMFPGFVYMYRPDVFLPHPRLREWIVFPINLLWHPEASARWGGALALLGALIAGGLVVLTGQWLERRDAP